MRVSTDKFDYRSGEKVSSMASEIAEGSMPQFQVLNYGADNIKGTVDDFFCKACTVGDGSLQMASALFADAKPAGSVSIRLDQWADGPVSGAYALDYLTGYNFSFDGTKHVGELDVTPTSINPVIAVHAMEPAAVFLRHSPG